MGLAQSQEETMRLIYSDPNFKGLGGAFDPARFQATIRQFGYTEQRYLAEQRRVGLRRQIAGTVSAGVEPPKVLIDALTRPPAAFVAAGKQTKQIWLAILGGSLLLCVLGAAGYLGILGAVVAVAAIVYLVDVRPAVREMRPGGPWG